MDDFGNYDDIYEVMAYYPCCRDVEHDEWVQVGMALKHGGYDVSVWEEWSRNDSRFNEGECRRLWNGFRGSANPVTMKSVYKKAREAGYRPPPSGHALEWDDWIGTDRCGRIDSGWLDSAEMDMVEDMTPAQQIEEAKRYLMTLFEPDEHVCYIFESMTETDGEGRKKHKPRTSGHGDRVRDELLQELEKAETIEEVFGDYNHEAGAWIRFNPTDGKGGKTENVTAYRWALIESDDMDIPTQNSMIREMELPVGVLLYSGGKSLHAIVHIGAETLDEYRQRVDRLYRICKEKGLRIDKQNKNCSRMSRFPGVKRGDRWQHIIDTRIGKESYDEWIEYIEEQTDTLPDPENLALFLENPPEQAPELIEGILRCGHKMLVSGPAKAGKSFLLSELALAIASGGRWMGRQCRQGAVLYLNLEIDKPSMVRRMMDIMAKLGLDGETVGDRIQLWNLRGKAQTLDRMLLSVVRRARKRDYSAVIIDPIYKVMMGDENSAGDMARFTGLFDRMALETGASVIFCHHHSKGAALNHSAMNRASGSGVFARDPDAIVDMVELDRRDVAGDIIRMELPDSATVWRVEATLREFPPVKPYEIAFDYPVHFGISGFEGAEVKGVGASMETKRERGRTAQKNRREDKWDEVCNAVQHLTGVNGGPPNIDQIAEWFDGKKGFSTGSIRRWGSQEGSGYTIRDNLLFLTDSAKDGE